MDKKALVNRIIEEDEVVRPLGPNVAAYIKSHLDDRARTNALTNNIDNVHNRGNISFARHSSPTKILDCYSTSDDGDDHAFVTTSEEQPEPRAEQEGPNGDNLDQGEGRQSVGQPSFSRAAFLKTCGSTSTTTRIGMNITPTHAGQAKVHKRFQQT